MLVVEDPRPPSPVVHRLRAPVPFLGRTRGDVVVDLGGEQRNRSGESHPVHAQMGKSR